MWQRLTMNDKYLSTLAATIARQFELAHMEQGNEKKVNDYRQSAIINLNTMIDLVHGENAPVSDIAAAVQSQFNKEME